VNNDDVEERERERLHKQQADSKGRNRCAPQIHAVPYQRFYQLRERKRAPRVGMDLDFWMLLVEAVHHVTAGLLVKKPVRSASTKYSIQPIFFDKAHF
jgi:hypothetical protein